MKKIQGISTDPKQSFTIILPTGDTCDLTLEYKPLQIGWFMGVSYKSFMVRVVRVTTNENILSQFANILPFGIACFTTSGEEPFFQEDFNAGNAALCILDQTDLEAVDAYIGTQV